MTNKISVYGKNKNEKGSNTPRGSLTSYESFDIALVGPPSTKYIVSETLHRVSTTIKTSRTHHNGDLRAEMKDVDAETGRIRLLATIKRFWNELQTLISPRLLHE